jgi:phospholipase/carboxylesterase
VDLGFEHVLERGSGPSTLLLLHSTGGDEHELVPLGRRLAPHATLLSPRGSVLENGRTLRFFRRIGPVEPDIEDLLLRTDELARFVRDAAGAYELDPARIAALGYSNGANIAASLMLRGTRVLRGAVLLRATHIFDPRPEVSLAGTGVLLRAGRDDTWITVAGAQHLAATLAGAGSQVRFEVTPAGHELAQEDLDDAARWLAERAPVS